jgi:diguanylate cyclase (GGDEF)-like protein
MIERAALRDDVKSLSEAQLVIRDQRQQIQQLESRIAELQADRQIDAVTGCVDRGGFEQTLEREWNRAMRGRTPVGLVFVDVDRFKEVNDRFGHPAGDQALRAIASALESEARRSGETVGRYGGDEFVIVIPQADLAASLAFAERARSSVSRLRMRLGEEAVGLSVSVGAASVMPSMTVKREELLRRADRAVYRAKEAGRGRAVALAVEDGVDVFYAPQVPTARSGPEKPEQARSASRGR